MIWLRIRETMRRPNGVVDYSVSMGNEEKPEWNGFVQGFEGDTRSDLLRLVAETIEAERAR